MEVLLSEKKIFEIYKAKRKYNHFYFSFKKWLNNGEKIIGKYRFFLIDKYKREHGICTSIDRDIEFFYFKKFMILNIDKDFQSECFYLAGYKSKKEVIKHKARDEKRKRREDYNDITNDFYSTDKWKWISSKVKNLYGRVCMKCGQEKGSMHADHILPRSLYPSFEFDIKNIQVLCKKCNLEKGNKEQIDYRTDEQIKKCNVWFP